MSTLLKYNKRVNKWLKYHIKHYGDIMSIKMTVVKGFKKDIEYRVIIKEELLAFKQEYYPEVKIQDIGLLIDNIVTQLQILQNLPLTIVVKKIGELIDFQINRYFKMCITDLGKICGDRIVKSIMEIEYYEHRENKNI